MTSSMSSNNNTTASLTASPAWQALALAAQENIAQENIGQEEAPALFLAAGDIKADLTRQPLSPHRWKLLHQLATQEDVTGWRDRLFAGAIINTSEGRAAEHWALRTPTLRADLAATDLRLATLVDAVQTGRARGATGKAFKHVVNVGIGGSDLGPRLLVDALAEYAAPQLSAHFITNIDPLEAARVLAHLPAEETLFVIASKSFSTLETKHNAAHCRAWWLQQTGLPESMLAQHFFAVSSNVPAATAFGISADNCFDFPDSIGGRYSLWGPVGLVPRLLLGNQHFKDFCAGAYQLDQHFQTAPISQNLPIALAIQSIWQVNFMQAQARAVLPYSHALQMLPAYWQQLVMESNGKSVTRTGQPVDYATSPVIFGAAGTVGQHSFYQQLHQGPRALPLEIILCQQQHPVLTHSTAAEQHSWLLANGLAQADAFWQGRHNPELPAHRQFSGGRPVSLLTLPALTPATLGQLLALYEHRTFVESVLWRINAFDQWGVELGKTMAETMFARITYR